MFFVERLSNIISQQTATTFEGEKLFQNSANDSFNYCLNVIQESFYLSSHVFMNDEDSLFIGKTTLRF